MIVRDGRTVFLEPFGLQDRERVIPAQRDTIFAITSLTKSFTCAAAMALVDDGKLALDDPIHRHLPAFREMRLWDGSPVPEPILMRHIMTHSSGLLDALPESFLATDYSLAELVDMGAIQPLAFPPGQRWAYSNLGFNALGRIVEIISGRPFQEFIHRRILKPLGMNDSFFATPGNRASRIAAAYASIDGSLVREELRFSSGSRFVSPSNGLYSTARDLARFWRSMLDRRILSRESVEAMITSQTGSWSAGFIPGCGYGLGCSVVTQPIGMFDRYSTGTFGHGGFFQTHVWTDPAAKLTAIVLCQHRCIEPVSDEVATFIARAPSIM